MCPRPLLPDCPYRTRYGRRIRNAAQYYLLARLTEERGKRARAKRKPLKEAGRKGDREKRECITRSNDNGNDNRNKTEQCSVDNINLYYTNVSLYSRRAVTTFNRGW